MFSQLINSMKLKLKASYVYLYIYDVYCDISVSLYKRAISVPASKAYN